MLTQFLAQMDGLMAPIMKQKPFVIVAANRPKGLDEVFMRRLPYKIAFNLPVKVIRGRILRGILNKDHLVDGVDLDTVAEETRAFSGSDRRPLSRSNPALGIRADLRSNEEARPRRRIGIIGYRGCFRGYTPFEAVTELTTLP